MNKLLWWFKFCMMCVVDDAGAGGDDIALDDLPAGDDAAEGEGEGNEEPNTMVDAIKQGLEEANPESKTDLKDGADGKTKADDKKPADKAGDKPAQTEEEKAAAEAAKKVITEDDLKMPDGLSTKAQERFQKLSSGYKEMTNQLQEVTAKYEQAASASAEFVTTMESVGAGPNELNQFIDLMTHYKTGNLEAAHAIISAELEHISTLMGKELPGVDLLKAYPDLLADVESLDITRERAIEIATARKNQERNTTIQTQQNNQTKQQQEYQQLASQTLKDVDAAMRQLSVHDIDYKEKERIIMASGDGKPSILERIVKNSHPSQWLNQLQIAYDAVQVPRKTDTTRSPNPLRSSSGGGEAAPGTMLEAIRQGLNQG